VRDLRCRKATPCLCLFHEVKFELHSGYR
jgi:hypothetical protein